MIDLALLPCHELSRQGARLQRVFSSEATSLLVAGRGSDSRAALEILRREYGFRAALHPDWAAMPEAVVAVGDGMVLLLQDPGGTLLRAIKPVPLPVAQFLRAACATTAAVVRMHAAQVIHRALTPDCILIDETSGRAVLTGFGFATKATDDSQGADEFVAWDDSSFDYMAPELGSRMNVGVDASADLYALGCIFHELLTGQPPFAGTDPPSRIHAHATRLPQSPSAVCDQVPEQLSRIVLRLLGKTADQRYASADSLLHDLRTCERLLARRATIPEFLLDAAAKLSATAHRHDVVGREAELRSLSQLYGHVASGRGAQAAWVWGPSGVGKSVLLRAALRDMAATSPALVAIGKCSAARSGVPFDSLLQALESLVQMALGCNHAEYEGWKRRLRQASEPVAATLAAQLPPLQMLLGTPRSESATRPSDAASIYEREIVLRAMARLIACFASTDRPLILVMDDLQWADADTLAVLERLHTDHASAPLLTLGSVRSETPGHEHPMKACPLFAGAGSLHIDLCPLDARATRELVGAMLQQPPDHVEPLVGLVAQWTGGNPFFIKRLLARLVADGALAFRAEEGRWSWDPTALATHPAVDIGELLHHELQALPEPTRHALQVLSCLGDRASLAWLAASINAPEPDLRARLAPAIAAGFVRQDQDQVHFSHDRIREAAYGRAAASERADLHLSVAQRLDQSSAADDAIVFAIATQANLARSAVQDPAQRRRFALVNLAAGKLARAATSHQAAMQFFGWSLIWFGEEQSSAEAREASLLCGEAEFMTGALEAAEARLSALQAGAGQGLFGADVARLRAALYTTLGRFDLALDIGMAFLAQAGIVLPRHPGDGDVDEEFGRVRAWLDQHGMDTLWSTPPDPDPLRRAIVDVIADLLPPALYSDPNLVDLMLLRMVALAGAHGHTDASANGYVCLIQVLGARYGDYAMSRAFGELALHLVNTVGLRRYQARVHHTYATFVVPFTAPARSARAHFARAFELALRTNDHTFALYCGRNQATGMLFAGEMLEDIRQTVEPALGRAREANFKLVVDALLAQRALLGRLQDGDYHGPSMAEPVEGQPPTLVDLAYWVYRLQLGVWFDEPQEALMARRRAEACQMAARSFAEYAELPFYGALALLQQPGRSADEDAALLRHLAALDTWAEGCPENFEARRRLVLAERARAAGRTQDAAEHYAAAVADARKQGFTQVEALAAELATRFFGAQKRDIEQRAYLRHAIVAWKRWGAVAKVRQLEQRHPELQDVDKPPATLSRLHELDVQAVLRVTHALASDIVPERMVATTMRTALEAMGADHGVLLTLRGEEWQVRAQASSSDGDITVSQAPLPLSSDVLPTSIALAVGRTQQAMNVDDAVEQPGVSQDDYVRRVRPRSLLCTPMMRYAQLVGVLYLENRQVPRVFTPAKADLLEVIASQAAFSLENTRLYGEVIEQSRQRAQAEDRLRGALADLARASRLKEMGELVASIVHEIGQPLSAIDTSASAASRWLARDVPDIAEATTMLSHVSLSAKRAKHIIQGLRALARRAEPQLADVELGDALRECAALLEGTLDELGVRLAVHAPAQDCHVHGDRVQLQQVAINLLMNGAEAMAAMPAEQRLLSIGWGLGHTAQVEVHVEDRGPGIAPEQAARLTEPFFTTKANGMGMGLAICKSIVEAHQGTLEFLPLPAGGTRVVLQLASAGQP